MQLYNSLSRKKEVFQPIEEGAAKLYTCGPTVYNFAHIGNFRAYIFEDLLRRTLKYCGYQVTQVMNLTDVDDKTIRDSQKAGLSLHDFTAKYKEAFFNDIKTLRIEPAEHYPEATEHIQEMIDIIKTLVEKNHAYQADDGSVYFSIASFPNYGQLVNVDPEQMRSSTRVKNDEYTKESVADFALWKSYDESDGDVCWDSPWGRGRPGWHIECSAMSMKYLGKSFDIHTGGADNMFPHHEDEIAQSEAANNCQFVKYWLHCAHLIVENQKMSKSLGNFYTLRDVLDKGYEGRIVRWVLLNAHYRQQLNFSFDACENAKHALARVHEFVERMHDVKKNTAQSSNTEAVAQILANSETEFKAALEDDLNISEANAALFTLIRKINKAADENVLSADQAQKAIDLLKQFDSVIGCLDIQEPKEDSVPGDVLDRVQERQDARKNKDFARADEIRDALLAEGWVIIDTPQGPRVKRENA
jgi:cysteinyl-tRNA synthetase